MIGNRRLPFIMTFIVLFVVFFTSHTAALAHGHTEVGDYELVIGFHNEPAYQGEPNGLDLFVTNTKTGEPVNGLEDTLRVEISYGSSTQELEIRSQWGEEGAYTAYVQPTEAGDYTWRIFGEIEGTPVDVSMTSGPDTFSPVEPKATIAFPAAEPTPAELQARLEAAVQSARMALIVGISGGVLGAAGIVVGLLGLRARSSTTKRQDSAPSPRVA